MKDSGVVNPDDMPGWYRHFVSRLSSIQTTALSSIQTTALSSIQTMKVSSVQTLQKTVKQTSKEKLQKTGAGAPEIIDGLNLDAWVEFEKYRARSKIRKLKPASVLQQQRWLVTQGDAAAQLAVVEETIRNGWQGLFELKGGANGNQRKKTATDEWYDQLQQNADG
jgi:hypothetical protein